MGVSPIAPAPAGGTAAHTRPAEVEARCFEFFPKAARREVLLLGDVVDLLVHYMPNSRRKKLCLSEYGPCELCEVAAVSPDVESSQAEYYAPSFVRKPKDREFVQRVTVYPARSAQVLQELLPLGSMRGKPVEVYRKPSRTLEYKLLAGLPKGLPALLPAAFDVLPFIRARYGLPQEAGRPMVELPPLRCEADARPGDRPARLTLSVGDFSDLATKTVEELRAYAAKCDERGFRHLAGKARDMLAAKLGGQPAEPVQAPPAPAIAGEQPSSAVVPEVIETVVRPAIQRPEPAEAGDVVAGVLNRAGVPTGRPSITPSPRKAMDAARRRAELRNPPASELTAAGALESGRMAEYVAFGPDAPATVPFSTNGHAKKGGAK